MVIALAGAATVYFKGRGTSQTAATSMAKTTLANSIELVATDVVTAQKRNMTQGLAISGTLKATRSAMVKARVAGELVSLEVREGDAVLAGQVIARVDATEYLARQRQAQQQAEAARAQAAEAGLARTFAWYRDLLGAAA